jgi:glycosyltransferase involved in cell wall biosynthesis
MNPPGIRQIIINGRFLTQKKTGVQRFAYEITTLLLLKNPDIVIVMPDEPIFEGYNVERWPIKKIRGFHGHFWEQISLPLYLFFTLKNGKEKILLNFCNTAPIFFFNKITAIHDLAVIHYPSWFNKKFSILYRYLLPGIVKTSRRLITVSNFSKNQIEVKYPRSKGKIEVIYNGSRHNSKIGFDEIHTLLDFGIKKNEYILAVSSIEPRKNIERLIAAYNLLMDKSVKLVLVGAKGKAFGQININTEVPGIVMAGYVNDDILSILYRNAICFIYPSLYEGFGIPPVEAMNNGCPVIVSDIPSLREISSDAVLYVNPYEIQDIADKIESLVSDAVLQEQLRIKGYDRAAIFDWNLAADQIEKILMKNPF